MVSAPEIRTIADPITFPPFCDSGLLDKASFGDWRDDLVTHGYAVVKQVIPKEKALAYCDRAHEWQEQFGLGYDRHDISTFKNECLPVHSKGGMIHGYGIGHEQWVWDVRCEAGVAAAYAKLWGTDELVVSFDAACIMLPHRTDVPDLGAWEHMDQSPSRRGFYCCQGIVNLNENGPDDGGLMVLKGSSKLVEQYFEENGLTETRTWGPVDWYGFTAQEQQWFFDHGAEWIKVTAGPGDFILWDSRTMHYNVPPVGDRARICTYVCMAPALYLSQTDKDLRAWAFANCRGTSHVPFGSIHSHAKEHKPKVRWETGKACVLDTGRPRNPRVATEQILRLAGLKPY